MLLNNTLDEVIENWLFAKSTVLSNSKRIMSDRIGENNNIITFEEIIILLSNCEIWPIMVNPKKLNKNPIRMANRKVNVNKELKNCQASSIPELCLIFINKGKNTVEWKDVIIEVNKPTVESKK